MGAPSKSGKAKKPNPGGYARAEATKKRKAMRHKRSLEIAAEYKKRNHPVLLEKALRLGFVVTRTNGLHPRKPSITQLRAFLKRVGEDA